MLLLLPVSVRPCRAFQKKTYRRVNGVIMITMKYRKKKPTFLIGERRPHRPTRPKPVHSCPDCRQPAAGEIADLAVELARGEHDLGPPMLELFHWPAWAGPCLDPRRLFLPVVEKYKKKAEAMLRRHYEYYHGLELHRKRWLRVHPRPRGWAWTRKQLKDPIPPPRRRGFIPPCLAFPDRGPPPPDGSPQRPGRRERERLLWSSWLFGNQIAL